MAAITSQEALLDISIMNAEASNTSFTDIFIQLSNEGLPAEVITRMEGIWKTTKVISGEVIQIGKIIVLKIFEFIKANIGLALGLAIGAAISAMVGMIPFIGPWLQHLVEPLLLSLSAFMGYTVETGDSPFEAAITLAKNFFKLLAETFNAIQEYWESRG